MKFDSAAFKAAWREECEKREIDPVEGATSFQVAGYKAEVAEQWRRHPFFARRWARPETALFWQEFEVLRSEVESSDVYDVLMESKRVARKLNYGQWVSVQPEEELIPVDVAVREIWDVLAREMRRDVVHQVPLRDLQSIPSAGVVVMV